MVKKRVDGRVQGLIEQGVRSGHRSLFCLVGDHGKDQVENLHRVLSKSRIKSRPSVLWCYKNELGFSTHRQKRMKEIKRNQARGLHDPDRDDPFDLFISSTNIRWTYYKDTDKVLGQTFGMCVLQDFEALTPNLLARTIETVEGGGLVILLFKTVKSLKQLYSMSMDVHSRYRTEAHHEIVPRFNERFILSLSSCNGCLVLDDELNILPITTGAQFIPQASDPFAIDDSHKTMGKIGKFGVSDTDDGTFGNEENPELVELKASLEDTPNVGSLVSKAKTLDQAKAILSFLDAISARTQRSTVSLTAARGRGKSAALGLCLAGAVGYGYSNIFLTAPSPENLQTTFQMLIVGLKALEYHEHTDFEVVYSTGGENGKYPIRVNIFKEHRQTVEYILPTQLDKLGSCELLAIDEAAAIPLPTVKALLGPYVVFLSSTVHGYEGTGRALSLKLIQSLRSQRMQAHVQASNHAGSAIKGAPEKKGDRKVHEERWKTAAEANANARNALTELTLEEPIRYGAGDPVESWLNALLCLDVANSQTRLVASMPAPRDCELFCVNRDSLFSYHALSELLLQRIWGLYTSAHYKNSPNDLQMLSDAPAHRLFVLLGPQKAPPVGGGAPALPDVLCVIQIAFEGKISQKSVQAELSKGNKASGDLIPWTISQQFGDSEFPGLSGARIVRVATHPDVQKMGYGSRAIDLLVQYFQGAFSLLAGEVQEGTLGTDSHMQFESASGNLQTEDVKARATLPPLLISLKERPAERLHWLGSAFGLTSQLLNFWSRKMFRICYVRQTPNETTGEFSCVVLRELSTENMDKAPMSGWLDAYKYDYRRRLVSLMSHTFQKLDAPVAISLVDPDREFTSTNTEAETGGAETFKAVVGASIKGLYGATAMTATELTSVHFSQHDLKRIDLYARNMVDHHMIVDTLSTMARLFFMGRLPSVRLSNLQIAVLVAMGLQNRDVDSVSTELNLPTNQVLAFFNKTIRKIASSMRVLVESAAAGELPSSTTLLKMGQRTAEMNALREDDDLTSAQQQQKIRGNTNAMVNTSKDLTKHGNILKVDLKDLSSAFGASMNKAGTFSVAIEKDSSASFGDICEGVTTTPTHKKDSYSSHKSSSGGDSHGKKHYSDKKDKKRHSNSSSRGSGGSYENSSADSAPGDHGDGSHSHSKKKKKHSK